MYLYQYLYLYRERGSASALPRTRTPHASGGASHRAGREHKHSCKDVGGYIDTYICISIEREDGGGAALVIYRSRYMYPYIEGRALLTLVERSATALVGNADAVAKLQVVVYVYI